MRVFTVLQMVKLRETKGWMARCDKPRIICDHIYEVPYDV